MVEICGAEKLDSSNWVGSVETSIDARLLSLAAVSGRLTDALEVVLSISVNRDVLRSVFEGAAAFPDVDLSLPSAGAVMLDEIGEKSGTGSVGPCPVGSGEGGPDIEVACVLTVVEEVLKAAVDVFAEVDVDGVPRDEVTREDGREGTRGVPDEFGGPVTVR